MQFHLSWGPAEWRCGWRERCAHALFLEDKGLAFQRLDVGLCVERVDYVPPWPVLKNDPGERNKD